MKVSVVTVFYNREDYVEQSISSLLQQTYKDLEIIAVDDGSTDKTFKKLSSFYDKRLKVIHQANQGFVSAIRNAIAVASGEIIAIHGAGDYSFPTRIEKQVAILAKYPSVSVVGCYVEVEDLVVKSKHITKKNINEKVDPLPVLMKGNLFTHGEVMFRKKLYEEVGGYRTYFKYAQDIDLWLRMSMKSSFFILDEVLYRRYSFSGGVGSSIDKMILQKKLAELARQCIEIRSSGNKDFIERFGMYAPFYMYRSKRLSKSLTKLSMFAFLLGDINGSLKAVQLSMNEKMGFLNVSFYFLLKVVKKNKTLKHIVHCLVEYIRNKKNNSEKN